MASETVSSPWVFPSLAVEPALGLGAVVVGVPAGVQNLGLRGEVPLLQGRRGGDQLEGGPRGVEPLDRPVHQGLASSAARAA